MLYNYIIQKSNENVAYATNLETEFNTLKHKYTELEKNLIESTDKYNRLSKNNDKMLIEVNVLQGNLESATNSLTAEENSHYETKDECHKLETNTSTDQKKINSLEKELSEASFKLNSALETIKKLTGEVNSSQDRNLLIAESYVISKRQSIGKSSNNSECLRGSSLSPKSRCLKPDMVDFGCQTRETNKQTAFESICSTFIIIFIFIGVCSCSEYFIYSK
jgi:chromosome segregation ATPase